MGQLAAARIEQLIAAKKQSALIWPTLEEFTNRETGRKYRHHHDGELKFVTSDEPRYMLAKGGEGGGKSVAGIVKTLYKLGRGLFPGVMGSPDFEHFKKSLWPEFRRWCPWDYVIPKHRSRANLSWVPAGPFDLIFTSKRGEVSLTCGGFDDPSGWEGPNLQFAYFDEARRHKDASMLKVLDGRCRIVGPEGEAPQIFMTTTPRKHWLYDYFGPLLPDDVRAAFKADTFVIDLLTAGNADNLSPGFVEKRRQSLTEAEARVLLEAAWEDVETGERFLPDIAWWDACREDLPPLGPREPAVVALDAATSGDSFGLVLVTRHPARPKDVAVRLVYEWKPPAKGTIDFVGTEEKPGPAKVLEQLGKKYNILQVTYDPYQLHQMMTELKKLGTLFVSPFDQGRERLEADKDLLDLVTQRRIAHTGNAALRAHMDNADRKQDGEEKRLRIVKREQSMKIDLAVCTSMASKRCLDLSL